MQSLSDSLRFDSLCSGFCRRCSVYRGLWLVACSGSLCAATCGRRSLFYSLSRWYLACNLGAVVFVLRFGTVVFILQVVLVKRFGRESFVRRRPTVCVLCSVYGVLCAGVWVLWSVRGVSVLQLVAGGLCPTVWLTIFILQFECCNAWLFPGGIVPRKRLSFRHLWFFSSPALPPA